MIIYYFANQAIYNQNAKQEYDKWFSIILACH